MPPITYVATSFFRSSEFSNKNENKPFSVFHQTEVHPFCRQRSIKNEVTPKHAKKVLSLHTFTTREYPPQRD